MTVSEGLVKEQFMEFFSMENKYSEPNHKNFEDIDSKSSEEQKSLLLATVIDFMKYFGYCNADTAEGLPQPLRGSLQYQVQKVGDENLHFMKRHRAMKCLITPCSSAIGFCRF